MVDGLVSSTRHVELWNGTGRGFFLVDFSVQSAVENQKAHHLAFSKYRFRPSLNILQSIFETGTQRAEGKQKL